MAEIEAPRRAVAIPDNGTSGIGRRDQFDTDRAVGGQGETAQIDGCCGCSDIGLPQSIADPLACKEPPGIDRKPGAENSERQKHAAGKAGDMMPVHPAAIGSHPPFAIAPLPGPGAQDADPHASHRNENSGAGHPEHHLAP